MADSPHGVYVSIRNTDGGLFSSNRAEWNEVEADLSTAFGSDFAEAFKASIGKTMGTATVEAAPVAAPPAAAPAAAPLTPEQEGEALALAEQMLGATPVAPVEAPVAPTQHQFETCADCGTPKDKWVPPGVSKSSGKRYSGFYGCPNLSGHSR